MRQCELSRGTERVVLWIDERGAKPGATVELIGEGEWKVEKAYAFDLPADVLREKQRLDRGSLPSIIGARG